MRYATLLLCSHAALANRQPESARMGNTDVVVDMPPEVWTQGQNRQQTNCLQCCIYENRSYSEGAVVKAEGVLLQCARNEKVLGTIHCCGKSSSVRGRGAQAPRCSVTA